MDFTAVCTLGVFILIMLRNVCYGLEESPEARLKTHIKRQMDLYGNSRPRSDPAHNVTVRFGLRLIQVTLDEANNLLKTSVWIRQGWENEYITWNASDYGGVRAIGIPAEWTWTPDVTLVNTGSTGDDARHADVRVYSDGSIFWLQHRMYESACLVDLRDYPYDQQTCHLWFQSLSYPSADMDLRIYLPGFDQDTYLTEFKEADEWEIVKNVSIRVRTPRELGELLVFSRRTTLRFSLTLRRRAGFQAYLLCVPCVVLGALSTLVFVLPPERPDRHAIATTLLGSFVLLLLILVRTAPPSAASVPNIGLLYAANIGMIIVSLALSSVVVNLSKRGDKNAPFPKFLEKITYTLGRVCFIPLSRSSGGSEKKDSLINEKYQSSPDAADRPLPLDKSWPVNDHLHNMQKMMLNIGAALGTLAESLTNPPQKSPTDGIKWKLLAGVMDRCFLILQSILIVIVTISFYPTSHYQ